MRPQDLHKIYTFAGESTHDVHTRAVPSAVFHLRGAPTTTPQTMKTNHIHLLLALAATVTASATEPKPPVDRRPPPPQPLLVALDANRDGKLSPDEIANSSSALSDLDKNDDGKLTRKELLPRPPKDKTKQPPPPARKGPSPLMAALDLDKDGVLSADEIEDAPLSLASLDQNDDGTISRKELNPGKPPIKQGT